MEDLRVAAEAYYNNSPRDVRDRARSFFSAMDRDRDGAVSFGEVNAYFQRCGYNRVSSRLFVELDRNRDGSLDFLEVLTLYYIMKTRDLWCKNCSSCLRGLYFTCSYCFDSHGYTTYDLCTKCYRARSFQHRHDRFVDSYMLLRQMKQTLCRRPAFKDFLKSSLNPKNYVEVRHHRNIVRIKHFDAVSCMSLNEELGLLYLGSWDKTLNV